jgi:serine/threonine protein kinase
MGEVYRATDTHLGRRVALKLLPVKFVAEPERLHRFQLEARSASALNHPNIITVYDAGISDEAPWIAMEYVEGRTLRADAARTRPDPRAGTAAAGRAGR